MLYSLPFSPFFSLVFSSFFSLYAVTSVTLPLYKSIPPFSALCEAQPAIVSMASISTAGEAGMISLLDSCQLLESVPIEYTEYTEY